MQVHPEYDMQTGTWFIQGFHQEGKTISQLLSHIPPHIRKNLQVKDYYVGKSAPTPRWGLTSATEFLQRADRPYMHTPKTIVTSLIPKDRRADHPSRRLKAAVRADSSAVNVEPPCEIAEHKKTPRRLFVRKPRVDWEARSTRDLSPTELKKLENDVLDLWAAGLTGPEIAFKFKIRVSQVGAQIIPRARRRGDPRAVIRNPDSFGNRRSGFHKKQREPN